jgi:preprotein translocase subunit SecA
VLTERGIGHALLNAKQDQDEAAVIAAAGQGGRVTVATNMAGRGTDIKLGPGADGRGGLHVILTEYHEQRRVDRQLFGRCARQGNPGSCQVIVSLDDEIFKTFAPRAASLFQRLPHSGPRTAALLRRVAQGEAERRAASARVQNLRLDLHTDSVLAFSGSGE